MNRSNNVFIAKARARYLIKNVTPWVDDVMRTIRKEFDLTHMQYTKIRKTLPWYQTRVVYMATIIFTFAIVTAIMERL
jgi:hypothetical protein